MRLKTACDLDAAKVEEAQAAYGIPNGITAWKSCWPMRRSKRWSSPRPIPQHVPLTLLALQAGKSVYVEKPLADTVEECEQVVAAQQAAGKLVAVGFNRRFAPAYIRTKELTKKYGGAWNIHYRIADEYFRWGRNCPPGTRVMHEVCHVFDMLRWMLGQEVQSVYCVASRADDEAIVLQFTGGCVATIMDCGYGALDMPKEYLNVMLEKGGITVEDFAELRCYGKHEPTVERYAGHTHPNSEFGYSPLYAKLGSEALHAMRRTAWELRDQVESNTLTGPHAEEEKRFLGSIAWNYTTDKGWLSCIDHFAQCVATGDTPDTAGPMDGLQATRLALAAIESRKTGQVVRV